MDKSVTDFNVRLRTIQIRDLNCRNNHNRDIERNSRSHFSGNLRIQRIVLYRILFDRCNIVYLGTSRHTRS